MNEWEELRENLVRYVKQKFYSRPQIRDLAEDIVNDTIAEVLPHREKCNFGYLSKACVHTAYRQFRKLDTDTRSARTFDSLLEFVDEQDVVKEIIDNEDTAEILASLEVLKQIERVIVVQRYFGDYSFAEIAESNHINLNTVLSHHRRALEKLRPRLAMFAVDRGKRPRAAEKDGDRKHHFAELFRR